MPYDDTPSDATRQPRQAQRDTTAEPTASAPADGPLERRETAGEIIITDDLDLLLVALPPRIRAALGERGSANLLEIVLDLGRLPEARYPEGAFDLGDEAVTLADITYVMERVGQFGEDNRAGIGGTLHRISAIRNRRGEVVGLTCRVGRAVRGTVALIRDVVEQGRSILILGRPGVGKTTLLREAARVLADELGKRVVVVDTSNEIAGDGDIPHPGIGRARRMQVAHPAAQHAVMIEAVENHMPEVIIIDEIGTELEAAAARTIAERGVQLVGTAHGRTLDNLLVNPTLSDLVGGIQTVTLGDEEARRRGTQKTVLERKAPPTFDVLIEQEGRHIVGVHLDVAAAVDGLLRGEAPERQMRERQSDGSVRRWFETAPRAARADSVGLPTREQPATRTEMGPRRRGEGRGESRNGGLLIGQPTRPPWWEERRVRSRSAGHPAVGAATMRWLDPELALSAALVERRESEKPEEPGAAEGETGAFRKRRIYAMGVSRNRMEQAIQELGLPAVISRDEHGADVIFVLKSMYRKQPDRVDAAQAAGTPVYPLRSASLERLREALADVFQAELGADRPLSPESPSPSEP